jgi:lysozyme
MNVSPPGRAAIEREEGTVLHWYRDGVRSPQYPNGIETGGTGHVRRPGDPNTFDAAMADEWLVNDLRVAESAVNSHSPPSIGQRSFDACCSLAFNVGGGAFATSSVARLMAAGDWHGAANAFLLFDKLSVGGKLVPSQALAARRMRERTMFLLDVPTTDDVA